LTDVKVVGRTRESDPLDIAFLKINDAKGKKLIAAKIGDSSKVEVGDKVVAIGNALGQFQNSVTSGIISGYGRSVQAAASDGGGVENLQDLFQTDAAINQGNSGGPLVNMNGEVIGINTAVAGGTAQDIGFAIPTANISGLIKTVISTGKFQQPYLGVRYVPLTNDIAQELELKVNRGAYILTQDQAGGQETVLPDSPAAKADLQPGDIILEVDGKKIDERNGLTVLLNQHGVNDIVTLKIQRDGDERGIDVKLEPAPES
jgi:serine protease Do